MEMERMQEEWLVMTDTGRHNSAYVVAREEEPRRKRQNKSKNDRGSTSNISLCFVTYCT